MPEFIPIFAALPESPTFYGVMMLAGFVIAVYGHAMKSRVVVGLGIALIFLATALLPLAVTVLSDEPPGRSPSVPGSPG